jgi:hypothetical protein
MVSSGKADHYNNIVCKIHEVRRDVESNAFRVPENVYVVMISSVIIENF